MPAAPSMARSANPWPLKHAGSRLPKLGSRHGVAAPDASCRVHRGERFGERLRGECSHVAVLHHEVPAGLGRGDQALEDGVALGDVLEHRSGVDEIEVGRGQVVGHDVELTDVHVLGHGLMEPEIDVDRPHSSPGTDQRSEGAAEQAGPGPHLQARRPRFDPDAVDDPECPGVTRVGEGVQPLRLDRHPVVRCAVAVAHHAQSVGPGAIRTVGAFTCTIEKRGW
jgi:hypothetical protein